MIRHARQDDFAQLLRLYRAVAAVPDGLARTPDEVSEAYVAGFMGKAAADGIELVYEEEGELLGEIHASRVGIASLAHLLTDLTIAVAPHAQGRGVGRALFQGLLDEVMEQMPHITRVELFARDSNVKARKLYTSLGFVEEGRLRARVNNARGEAETDTVMGWLRPARGFA
ncbi:GNAT family N-acetyltransferase [Massilia sp. CF038]|jgi:ribosomal protein S18 acetylase RimI-like enzyme|uniref:GNAT family N-acetyltransferase n=1 Tax=Massilia sp. CF038 TaxID=1881045 RepID=UPI00092271D7|nr:GNAT family N-acetyltransferase [Massilia sp. CF038]SHH42832.1 Ribosomal protein S18 acetylase RimI [Massilia sp. CF038]